MAAFLPSMYHHDVQHLRTRFPLPSTLSSISFSKTLCFSAISISSSSSTSSKFKFHGPNSMLAASTLVVESFEKPSLNNDERPNSLSLTNDEFWINEDPQMTVELQKALFFIHRNMVELDGLDDNGPDSNPEVENVRNHAADNQEVDG